MPSHNSYSGYLLCVGCTVILVSCKFIRCCLSKVDGMLETVETVRDILLSLYGLLLGGSGTKHLHGCLLKTKYPFDILTHYIYDVILFCPKTDY